MGAGRSEKVSMPKLDSSEASSFRGSRLSNPVALPQDAADQPRPRILQLQPTRAPSRFLPSAIEQEEFAAMPSLEQRWVGPCQM